MNKYPMNCQICEKLGLEPEIVQDSDDYFVHVYITHPEHNKGISEGKTFEQVEKEKSIPQNPASKDNPS